MRGSLPIWTKLWLVGGVLVFLGAVIPFLIVLGYLPSGLWLLGGAMLASIIGVFLGYYAMTVYVRVHRRGPPRE
ncbi:MAG: hypothetical protein GXP42_19455 [Chloroflexi bacterium]|nr:hypothetical protein [Chloroflexota bacterium]